MHPEQAFLRPLWMALSKALITGRISFLGRFLDGYAPGPGRVHLPTVVDLMVLLPCSREPYHSCRRYGALGGWHLGLRWCCRRGLRHGFGLDDATHGPRAVPIHGAAIRGDRADQEIAAPVEIVALRDTVTVPIDPLPAAGRVGPVIVLVSIAFCVGLPRTCHSWGGHQER